MAYVIIKSIAMSKVYIYIYTHIKFNILHDEKMPLCDFFGVFFVKMFQFFCTCIYYRVFHFTICLDVRPELYFLFYIMWLINQFDILKKRKKNYSIHFFRNNTFIYKLRYNSLFAKIHNSIIACEFWYIDRTSRVSTTLKTQINLLLLHNINRRNWFL